MHFRIKYIAVKQHYESRPIAKETRVRLMDIMLSGSFWMVCGIEKRGENLTSAYSFL